MSNFCQYEKDVRWVRSFGSKRRFDNYVVYCFALDEIEYKYIGFRTFNQFTRAESFAYHWSKQGHNHITSLELLQGDARAIEYNNGRRCG